MLGLYLHVPYCASKCRYCNFYSAGGSHGVPDAYINAILRELQRFAPCGNVPLRPDSVYFGGGTPSLLTAAQARRLLAAAAPVPGAEITLEANPEGVTQSSLQAFREAGVNRISFGVQTARNSSLARLGRRHTAAQARSALAAAQAAGFANICGDMMLALPEYTSAELHETVALLVEGGCTHISCYLLKVEPDTAFGRNPPPGLPGPDAAADFYLEAVALLAQHGFVQYEISNFAKPGFAGKHNTNYWDCGDWLGLGPAAHSSMGGKRFSTPTGTAAFIQQPVAYQSEGSVTANDYCMLQLRLTRGLSLAAWQQRFAAQLSARQLSFVRRLCAHNLAKFDGDTLCLTPQGMLVQNSILAELL